MNYFQSYFSRFFVCFLLLTFSGVTIHAQKKDSIAIVKKDSIELSKWKKLYKKYLYKEKKSTSKANLPVHKVDINCTGKPIRNIYITTHDPFGYSLQDTTRRPEKWLERFGNSMHGKSKNFVVKELLLFKKGDLVDSLVFQESERVLRSQRILRRVEIKTELSDQLDSVDVYVNTIDSWSMIATGSITTSRAGIRVRERNFLGLGHVFDNRYRHNYTTGNNLYQFNYTVPNIAKSRVVGNINYFKNEAEHYNKSISFVRPFYSTLAKYAGGFSVGQNFYQDSLDYGLKTLQYHNFKYNYTDIWAARAFRISRKENSEVTNFIVSARYYDRTYKESPVFSADPYQFFSDQRNYYAGVGISSRRYKKDRFIYNYDIDEDVAIGRVVSLVGGLQQRPEYHRYYLGGKLSAGDYVNTGYLAGDIQYGSYFRDGITEQTALSIQSLYFSKLINLGKWRMRQFSKVNYMVGFNRWDTTADELTLNEHDLYGIDGIRGARNLKGDQRLILEIQTQTYSPYEFLGFRISPFFNAALGVVGNRDSSFFEKDNMIARIGLGVMFSNDYFIFNNFHFSFSYYPRIPGEGTGILKTNVIDNRDFQLMNYDFSKPAPIRWNRWD